nr:syntaxin-10 [Chrysemys picta bellii]
MAGSGGGGSQRSGGRGGSMALEDPFSAVRGEVQKAVNTARGLYERWGELLRETHVVSTEEFDWTTNELRNSLRSIEWDLEDLEETIDILRGPVPLREPPVPCQAAAPLPTAPPAGSSRAHPSHARPLPRSPRRPLLGIAGRPPQCQVSAPLPTATPAGSSWETLSARSLPRSPQRPLLGVAGRPSPFPPSQEMRDHISSPSALAFAERKNREMLIGGGASQKPPPERYGQLREELVSANSRYVEEQQLHQQLIIDQQDEQLELVSGSIRVLKHMSGRVGDELDEQSLMLEEFAQEMDSTQSHMDGVLKKMAKVSHMTSDRRQWCVIGILLVLLIVVLILFFTL